MRLPASLWHWRQWGCTAWCLTLWRNGQTSLGFAWCWAHCVGIRDRVLVYPDERGGRFLAGLVLPFALNRIVAKWAEGIPNEPVIFVGSDRSHGFGVRYRDRRSESHDGASL